MKPKNYQGSQPLSLFLPKMIEKARQFFKLLKKSQNDFVWDDKCEKTFIEFKNFLATPIILSRPTLGVELLLCLFVSNTTISSVLMQDNGKRQLLIYFTSRVLLRVEQRYQMIEQMELSLVTSTRRLHLYFQSHLIKVKTNHPIRQVLQKPELDGRMVAWSMELATRTH